MDVASRCASECLASDPSSMERCIRLCLDCADITVACVRMIGCNSEFSAQMCGVCADLCEACAEECERHGDGSVMRKCAGACRRCAENCRQMAAS